MKKFFSCLLAFVLIGCISTPAFALDDASLAGTPEAITTLETPSVRFDDGGMVIEGVIYKQETDNNEERMVYYTAVGSYEFDLDFLLDNGIANVRWYFNLTNGDYIKGVKGTFELWKDILGPINSFIDSAKVDEYYHNSFLGEKHSMECFNLLGEDLEYDTAVIFEWDEFKIQGGAGDYFTFSGNQQGKVSEFPL